MTGSVTAYVVCDMHGKYFCADAGRDMLPQGPFCAGCGRASTMVDVLTDAQLYSTEERAREACVEGDIVVPVQLGAGARAKAGAKAATPATKKKAVRGRTAAKPNTKKTRKVKSR